MEFNLNTVSVCDYNRQIKTKATVEADVIVPDTKPDIYRILSVKALADVSERYMRKDKVIFSGKVKFNILYVGESDKTKICSIEYSSPFNHQADMPGADDSALSIGMCNVSKTVFDVKNSRKLSVGAVLDLKAEAVRQSTLEAISGESEISDIPSRSSVYECDYLAASKEFEFTVSDSLMLPSTDDACEIYDVSVRPDISEIKTVNNKAVIKGNANVQILYGADGEISDYDTEIAFTEIVDIDSISSDHTVSSHFEVADCVSSLLASESGTEVDIDFKVRGSICAYAHSEYSLASDIYSPDYSYDIKNRKASLIRISKANGIQTTVKDSIVLSDTEPSVSKIHFMDSSVSHVSAHGESSAIKLSGAVENVIIYSDENGNLYRLRHTTPFETELVCDSDITDGDVMADISCLNYGYILASSREIQTRVILRADGQFIDFDEINLITDFKLDTKSPIQKTSQPSIIVFYPDADTDIWDIAKKYNTTCEEIIRVNSLDDSSSLSPDKPILIPKRQISLS